MSLARPNTFEIDLTAVARCTTQIRTLIGPDTMFFATLKAGGYGYGVLPVARVALASGANALSLASLADAVMLRESGISAPIMVYAGTFPDEEAVRACETHGLMPTIVDNESFEAWARHATRPLAVAVKVDVGPERVGVPMHEALELIARVGKHPLFTVAIVNAHPNVRGGERAAECLEWQYQRLEKLYAALDEAGIAVRWRVMASSKVLKMAGARMAFNAVDPGAALFSPVAAGGSAGAAQAFHALKSRVLLVRTVVRDEYLDEAPFPMQPGMRVGLLPIGYSDGVHRLHAGHVLVHGQRAPVLGNAALEYLRIDLSHIEGVRAGDEAVLIGSQGDERIAPEEAMAFQQAARVIDLALQVGPAVRRIYMHT